MRCFSNEEQSMADHGHTPAAWTGVIIVFIGFCVAGGFMVADKPIGFWVGMGVIAVGALVGWGMKLAGMGQQQSSSDMRA
jgi:hypothetical protein